MPFWIFLRCSDTLAFALPNFQSFPCSNIGEKWEAWLYKRSPERHRKPLAIERKASDSWRKAIGRKSHSLASCAVQVRSKVKCSLLTSALHHCWGSLQPPRSSSSGLSPAAQCCCGIGNLLWLREIMEICFSKPKQSQTKFRREKTPTETADLTGEALGIFLHVPQFSVVFPGPVIRKIITSCLLLLFFLGGWWWGVIKWGQTDSLGSSKVKLTSPTCLKAFQEIARLKSFFLQNIEDL